MPETHNDAEPTLQELIERISVRLRPVCSQMADAEFGVLIEQMARLEHKYIHRQRVVPPKPQDGAGLPRQ